MEKKKEYTVIGPRGAHGLAPVIVTIVAESFVMIDGGPLLDFQNASGATVALHHLAPTHTVTVL